MLGTLYWLMVVLAMGTSNFQDVGSWSDQELARWFEAGQWKQGWQVTPDVTLDRRELARQIHRNPKRWARAFSFLANTDLTTLATGRHELEGDRLFVNVDEYVTRPESATRFEAHRQYADIQYVVRGKERIGVIDLERTTVVEPYDAARDIAFMTAPENNYRVADPGGFFVFFPDDAHRPGGNMGSPAPVRKVVVKVGLD